MRAARSARRCSSGISCSATPRQPQPADSMRGSLLGPRVRRRRDRDVSRCARRALHGVSPTIERSATRSRELHGAREGRSAGSRAGWSSARARSARAASSATRAARRMQSVMNLKIKFRESFRPFAPVGARRSASPSTSRWRRTSDSPYMLLVAPVRDEQRTRLNGERAARARQAEGAAVGDAGGHARRLLGARADGRRRAARPLLRADEDVRASRPAAR